MEKREIYEFGDFRLDVDEYTIERIDGHALDLLPNKSFQALVLLVLRHGHLVTKDELIRHIWPDTVVEENNLEQRIHYLRHFLGKGGSDRSFIETVRGHGYRFVENVNVVEVSQSWLPETYRMPEESSEEPVEGPVNGHRTGAKFPQPPGKAGKNDERAARTLPLRKLFIVGCALGVVVATVVLGYFGFARTGSAGTPRSIVILPVAPIKAAERDDLYELGIADSLINSLAKSDGFTVRSLNAIRGYTGPSVDPIDAGREQKVDYVLASHYQIANGSIKVTGQLYNLANGQIEDTFQCQYDATKVFAAQDAIAADLGKQLMARFNGSPSGPVKGRGTNSEEAYRLYLQGMALVDGRKDVAKGVDYLEQSVALDPSYAKAWAGLALGIWPSSPQIDQDQKEVYLRSMEAVNKALVIDPNLSDAYSALCWNKLSYDYDFAAAEVACRQAIQLDPNSSRAHNSFSWVLSFHGRHDEALAEIRTAIDLEPVSHINQRDYGNALYLARRYDEAAIQWRRLIELDPNDFVPYNQLIRTLEAQGKYSEAFDWFIKLLILRNKGSEIIQQFTNIYQTSGWRGVLLERVKYTEWGLGNAQDFLIAGSYAQAGEKNKAFEHLEKAYQRREWTMLQLQVHPQLDSIRDDPRFADLVRRIEDRVVFAGAL